MISQFTIQNYKALRDVTLDLTPMHLLIGPNDSGKTSILEAIAALCRSVDRTLPQAFAGSWTGDSLIWHGAADSTIELTATFADTEFDKYRLACRFSKSNREVKVEVEQVLHEGRLALSLPYAGDWSGVNHVVERTANGPEDAKLAAIAVSKELKGVQLYHWVPRHLALPVAPDAKRGFRMEPSGFGLALCLDGILGYDRDRFIALENRFKEIFPQVKSIKLIQEPAYKAPVDDPKQVLMLQNSDGKGIHFQFQEDTKLVSAANVSDGVLLVLAYLAVLYSPEPPRVLLVEEPENGIHPARLREVLTILRDLVEGQDHTQVILTTHSPYVVDFFKPEEVTLCHKGDDGAVKVRRLSESKPVREQMDVFTLGEIWTGSGDDNLMERAVVADEVKSIP